MRTLVQTITNSFIKQFFILASVLAAIAAQYPAQAAETSVSAVLFYSPSCGHCEKVITEVLPPVQEKYGNRLSILGIDVTYAEGQELYQAAVKHFQIPADRIGVPTMIVGDTILVGSVEIPEKFEQIVEQGLENGGIDWPEIPGLEAQISALSRAGDPPSSESPQTTVSPAEQAVTSSADANPRPRWMQMFLQDVPANSVAVLVLIVMVIAAIASVINVIKPMPEGSHPQRNSWLIPALVLIGIFIAAYMTYVEITKDDAICGPVGDCNAVQQSPYAFIFGVLPVGVFGLLGYLGIGAAWLVQRYGPASMINIASLSMWGMSLFGVVFSIYLTFLEPFVIGASCIWCISSAIVITLILVATTNFARAVDEGETELEMLDEVDA